MRKNFIAANWKMHKTNGQAAEFFREFLTLIEPGDLFNTDIAVFAPFTALETAATWLEGSGIFPGAQNMHFENSGAYTGEISAEMLREIGVKYALIGHSERRRYFAETDATVNKKVLKALAEGILPMVCIGERSADDVLGLIPI